jgi:hypothetical protein
MDLLIMKEPISRLQAVEDAAVQALDFGDHDRALYLRMQVISYQMLITSSLIMRRANLLQNADPRSTSKRS